jgi:hypothetical protein
MALVNDGSKNHACRAGVCDLGRLCILGLPLFQTLLVLGGTLWTGLIGIALVGTLGVALISSSECEFGSSQ